ncbi:MAG: selenide, water dikinase SelD, partial [Actinobacteria bacterium]|nr:selenide, water dikinase SelD [Actinomycetota bacterium]
WGRIAANNSVSDVYAMGGRPLFGLNLVGWNSDELSTELLGEVLAGAADVAAAGGWVIAGGHTVDDPEPKFGLAVVGEVHPDQVTTVAGLRAGDVLVVTKPIGVGIVTTALKAGRAPNEVVDAAVAEMVRSNADAATAARAAGATGATDVTGFGLLGHLRNMLAGSGVSAEIDVGAVPVLRGARELADAGLVPGGSRRNLDHVRPLLRGAEGHDETTVALLADAQTSGGLLFGAASPEAAEEAVATLTATGHTAAVIGRIVAGEPAIQLS